MDEKINDGGPAFPTALIGGSAPGRETGGDTGMSLRDYFAAQAMQAIVGSFRQTMRGKEDARYTSEADLTTFDRDMALDINNKTGDCDGASEIAFDAYAIADSMLQARGEQC